MAAVVPALIPVATRTDPGTLSSPTQGKRPPLPMSRLPVIRDGGVAYGLAAVDARGRIADQRVLAALGWGAGTRLAAAVSQGSILAKPERDGKITVAAPGHLRLPVVARSQCGLRAGDRVLLVALPDRQRLIVHPPAVLDAIVAVLHATVLCGDPA